MTIHDIHTFFEPSIGYLLGSDSRAGKEELLFFTEKAFFGRNYVGLIMGNIDPKLEGTDKERFEAVLRSLDGVFEDIEAEKNYSTPPLLENSRYLLHIAKRNGDALELYWLSNVEGINYWGDFPLNTAMQMHTLTRDSRRTEKGSTQWIADSMSPIVGHVDIGKYFSLEEVKADSRRRLTKDVSHPERELGKPNLYVVSFDQLGNVE